MGYAHEYATAILQRGRIPMAPADFVPDWSDGPRKGKYYPGVDMMPLPDTEYPRTAALDHALGTAPAPAGPGDPGPGGAGSVNAGPSGTVRDGGEPETFDLAALSGMLLDSYGLTGRRLGVQANTDLNALPHYPLANWSRGTASGGGLYPVSVYWVSGASGPAVPGVHYYSTRHHAMQRLLTGDVSGEVRAALDGAAPPPGGAAAGDTDQFLVLGIKYWQNSFKYNSFSFHAVSMDVGTCLQTWRMWAGARGLRVEPAFWFDEQRLARLLGVRPEDEGIFAVVPLDWAAAAPSESTPSVDPAVTSGGASAVAPGGASASATPAADGPSGGRTPSPSAGPAMGVTRRDVERSRRVLSFEALQRMQEATSAHATARPGPRALEAAAAPPPGTSGGPGGAPTPLPAPRPMPMDVRSALRRRRSSFGRFDAQRPVSAEQFSACLAAADAGARLGGDLPGQPRLVQLYAFVNHVSGVAPGSYVYDPEGHRLHSVREGAPGAFLQENYFLSNYNLEQAGAVLVPTVRISAVLDAVGDRGYRLANATIGAVSQALYTAAAALDLGCGVALGFDNIAYIEELRLESTGEAPLLIMMVGNERPREAGFRYEIA